MSMEHHRMHANAVIDAVPAASKEQRARPAVMKGELSRPTGRMVCIDAMRGFDMFLIIGADDVIRALAANSHNRVLHIVGGQFEHVAWSGCHLYDLIFPIFLFIIGASMPFSLGKRMQRGDSKASIYRHVFKRVAVLVLLGMVINGNLLSWNIHRFTASYSVLLV